MNRAKASITGIWLAFCIAACGGGGEGSQRSEQGGSGGSAATSGGSTATNSGGSNTGGNGIASGGTSAGGSKASGGNPAGGQGQSGGAAAGGTTAGGTTSTSGGTSVGGSKASGGNPAGGQGQSGGAAAGGTTAGGTTSTSGGSSVGGSGSGGNPAGGQGQSGGAAAGGTTAGGTTSTSGGTSVGGSGSGGNPAGGQGQTGGSPSGGTSTSSKPDLIVSGKDTYWKEGALTTVTSGTADVTVNPNTSYQRWDGFGGTFNEAGWAVLSLLTQSQITDALKLLFDAQAGAGFVYGRLPIGASDYAISRYTLAETAGDYTMSSFSIARDREKLIPYIKAALAINPNVRLWASPWSPPAWMKDNNNIDAGNMKDDAQVLSAFALYLAKFVEEYAKENLTIWAVHPQNEPGYAPAYPSCLWTSALYIKFIKDYLGPTFKSRSVPAEIWCGTMSAPEDGTIATTLANDSAAMQYVKGFGLQWNTRDKIATLAAKNVPVMQTEHKCGNYSFATDYWDTSRRDDNKPQNDHAYGEESWQLIRDWMVAGVNSYSAWNMVLDTEGKNINTTKPWPQNALLVVDRNAKTLTITPAYYVFRHYSYFIAPGATRVGASGSFGSNVVAFKNPDGSVITELYNSGDASKKTTVSVSGTLLQFDIPAHGWATLNYSP